MATTATIGTGVTLGIDETGGTTFTTVAEVTSVNLNMTCGEADATALDSGGIAQFIPTVREATLTVSGNFLPDSHDLSAGPNLYTKFQARATIGWQITWNDPTTPATATGTGFITELTPSVSSPRDPNAFSMTIRVDGNDVTFAGMATV